ncbi:MAG: recombinase RecT [Porphyromonadaceae bacterium]|nr:recombinase RecT [Porphyromonadaceae bacterium]
MAQTSTLKLFNETLSNPRTQSYLESVLATKKNSFVNNISSLVANNATLQACQPLSVIYAGIKATALDLPLDPNLGFAYVIPYTNRKSGITEAQFQIGYKGFIQLAIRSGQYRTINVTDIKAGELKDFDLLAGEMTFEALPAREKLPTIGYAAFIRLTNGFEKTLYMTKEEVEAHAYEYSQTYKADKDKGWTSSQWSKHFDAMSRKTVLKRLLSGFGILSVEMQQAITADQAVFNSTDGAPRYADNDARIEDVVAEEVPAGSPQAKANDAMAKAKAAAAAPAEVVDAETGELLPTDGQGDDTLL